MRMEDAHRNLCETVTDGAVTSAVDQSVDPAEVLAAEAERFRRALADSRSTIIVRLFDYLLARGDDHRAPKEIEIAVAVFGKEATFDTAQDSIARVHVHRLRKRLDDFYASSAGPRLVIPNGEYRILLAEGSPAKPSHAMSSRRPLARRTGETPWLPILAFFAALVALPWAVALLRRDGSPRPDVAGSPLWRPIAALSQKPLIVAGDYYLFAETENEKDVQRLIMQPAIRSRRDLGSYSVQHPEAFFRYYDQDIHNVPAATTTSLWSLLSLMSGLRPDTAIRPDLIVSSRLSEQHLRTRDLIYVGRLSALGTLSDQMSYASGFKLGNSPNELIDVVSAKRYVAGATAASGGKEDRQYSRDYGYIASFPNPFGRRVVIIAGLGDAGVSRMIDLVANKRQLDQITGRNGDAAAFEALYQVKALGNMTVSSSLLISRALKGGNDRNSR